MVKVKYVGCSDEQANWGNNDDPRDILTEGEIYTLSDKEVHSWHTKYSIEGFKGQFNSVCFEEVEQ